MKIKQSSINRARGEDQDGAFISERFRNPANEMAATTDGGKYTFFGIVAIVSTILMAVVTALLYFNWDAFDKTGLFLK